MTRQLLITGHVLLCAALLLATPALAEKDQPTTQPSDEKAKELPEGHPPIGKAKEGMKLPKGHPPIGKAQSGKELPAGHPPIGGQANIKGKGTIVIRAENGTEKVSEVGPLEATVQLYQRGKVVKTLEGKLDEHGVLMFEKVELVGIVQPVVLLKYKDVTYRTVGRPMAATHPDQIIKAKVYETTEKQPAWKMPIRHLVARQGPHGLHVTDMLVIENPTDRTWMGAAAEVKEHSHAEGEEGHEACNIADMKKQTVVLSLPKGAQAVKLGGAFDACCTKVGDGQIIMTTPLQPGAMQYQINYIIPAEKGAAAMKLELSADTDRMVLAMPDDGTKVQIEGLAAGEAMGQGKMKMRLYNGEKMKAGTPVVVKVSEMTQPVEPTKEGQAATQTSAKAVAGFGSAALAVTAAFVLLRKGGKSQSEPQTNS